jgi:long-chain acyl-CoA synthetase
VIHYNSNMNVNRLFDLLDYSLLKYSKSTALSGKIAGKWVNHSNADFKEASLKIAYALILAGIKPGDRVVNISNNRPEWNFIDMGIQMAGAIHIPVYPVISNPDLIFIMRETAARIAFAGNNFVYSKLKNIRNELTELERIVIYDSLPDTESLSEFVSKEVTHSCKEDLEKICEQIQPDDLATIIYTSGTTSNPKGVMLSHRNIISNFMAVAPTFKLKPTFSALSYLPLCHVYERMLNYMYIYSGVSVYYAESIASITDNIREVRPHVLTTVPLLLEKIFQGVLNNGSMLEDKKKKVFDKAVILALKYPVNSKPSISYSLRRYFYDKLVFKKWREALGGRLSRTICGGAALQPSLLKVFWAAGIPVYEGYGLTETSPVISNNSNVACKLGTVGKIIDGTQVKIDSDGEILTKGPCVMLGYYFLPNLTFEVIDQDGWFHTGDVGAIIDGRYLKLTGRKKMLFKTSNGLYISPEAIENKLKQSLFINQALVVGSDKSYLGVIIIPDFNYILKWFEQKGLPFINDDEMVEHAFIIREIEKAIWEYNKDVFETERIEKYKILKDEWTIEKGEITPKMSLKRNFLAEKYSKIIDDFFCEQ